MTLPFFNRVKSCSHCGTIGHPQIMRKSIIWKNHRKIWCDETYSELCSECGNILYSVTKPKWIKDNKTGEGI